MYEQGIDSVRSTFLQSASGDRKRGLSTWEGLDSNAKRRTLDGPSMSILSGQTDTSSAMPKSKARSNCSDISSPRSSFGIQTPSYPVSSLFHTHSHADVDTDTIAQYSQPRSSSGTSTAGDTYFWPCQSSAQVANSKSNQEIVTKPELIGQYDGRNYTMSFLEQEYLDQHEYPYSHQMVTSSRDNYEEDVQVTGLHPQQGKRNRFNLSRYQLEDVDVGEAVSVLVDEEVKLNIFKSQRERIMQLLLDESDGDSGSTLPGIIETSLPEDGEDDISLPARFVSQREQLQQFRNEHADHVVIPNDWEGERQLEDWVGFGNIEDALRPLGLMMARAALVSDSVTSRHNGSSTRPSCGRTGEAAKRYCNA